MICGHIKPEPTTCRVCFLHLTRADYAKLGGDAVKAAPGWGDRVASMLDAVGVSKDRVASWLGGECGCEERQQKLNALGKWVEDGTKAALERLLGE